MSQKVRKYLISLLSMVNVSILIPKKDDISATSPVSGEKIFTNLEMAEKASLSAMHSAGISNKEIDMILYSLHSEVNILKAVTFENVSKTYNVGDSEVTALDHVSFSIEDESVTVILGPSGSGKSTMLNLIGGMDRASSGCIRVSDTDISKLNEFELTEYRRKKIGFVFQFYNLIPSLNALENVSIVAKMTSHSFDAKEMIRSVGLEDRCQHFPDELSGGEMQRLSIARAICKNPDILLCDEPTGALDSATGRSVLQLLTDMARKYNKTVIIVTHNASIALCANEVIHLKDGRIEFSKKNEKPLNVDEVNW